MASLSNKFPRMQFVKSKPVQNAPSSSSQLLQFAEYETVAGNANLSKTPEKTETLQFKSSGDYFQAWKLEKDPDVAKLRNLAYQVDLIKSSDRCSKSKLHSAAFRVSLRIDFTTKKVDEIYFCYLFIQGISAGKGDGSKMKDARSNAYDITLQNILKPYLRIIQTGPNSKELQASTEPFTSLPPEPPEANEEANSMEVLSAITSHNKESNMNTAALINRIIKPLNKFIIMEPKIQNERSVMYTLQQSADLNQMLLEYEYFFEDDNVRCQLSIEKEILADVTESKKSTVRIAAAVEACMKLKKICWTIKTKFPASKRDADEEPEVFTKKALGLGTPEEETYYEEFQKKIKAIVENFVAANDEDELIFSSEFSPKEIQIIHDECKVANLHSKVKGKNKWLYVWRSFDLLFDYLMALGGENYQYRLVPPGEDVSSFVVDHNTRVKCWDNYRDPTETSQEWLLRKQFMAMNSESLEPDRLICLSRCLVNAVFYGCSYPPAVMKEIQERSFGIRETKVIESNKESLSSDKTRDRPWKRPSNTDIKREHGPSLSKRPKTMENEESLPENSNGAQISKNESKSLNDLILIENIAAFSSHQIIMESTDNNRMDLDFKFDRDIASSQITCHVIINNQTAASGSATNKADAKTAACDNALKELRQLCWCVKVKSTPDAGTVVTREDVCWGNVKKYEVPDKNNVVNKMMQSMGWLGGSLGKNEQGRLEPVALSQSQSSATGRLGLGSTAGLGGDFDTAKVKEFLEKYAASNGTSDLVFTSDFTKEERQFIHIESKKLHLRSKSRIKGVDRYLTVSRKWAPSALVNYIRESGGETEKYLLIAPGTDESHST